MEGPDVNQLEQLLAEVASGRLADDADAARAIGAIDALERREQNLLGARSPADATRERVALIRKVAPAFDELAGNENVYSSTWVQPPYVTLWTYYLPLAEYIVGLRAQVDGRPFVVGIVGGSSTGKSTLAKSLLAILKPGFGMSVAGVGVDRFVMEDVGGEWFEFLNKYDVPGFVDAVTDARSGAEDVLLIEGWMAATLVEEHLGSLTAVYDLVVYLDASLEYLRSAIMAKDRWECARHGIRHDEAEALHYWNDAFSHITERFVMPYRAKADLMVDVESFARDAGSAFMCVRS